MVSEEALLSDIGPYRACRTAGKWTGTDLPVNMSLNRDQYFEILVNIH